MLSMPPLRLITQAIKWVRRELVSIDNPFAKTRRTRVSTSTKALGDRTLRLKFYSTTMKIQSALGLLLAADFIQTAAGLHCDSECAACWKTGDTNGVDIKLSCGLGTRECGDTCPQGYEGIHCAKRARCQ